MITRFSQLMRTPVLSLKERKQIAVVIDIVIQKTDLKIKGFIVKTSPILPFKSLLSFTEVVEIANNAVVVRDEESLSSYDDMPSMTESIGAKLHGVGQKVVTKTGNSIGKVYDYTLDNKSGMITSLYVKSILNDRIISRTAIIDVDGKKFTIEDDFELIKNAETIAEPA